MLKVEDVLSMRSIADVRFLTAKDFESGGKVRPNQRRGSAPHL